MNRLANGTRSLRLSVGILVLGLSVGCSSGPPQQGPPGNPVEITDLKMVVGRWEGIVKQDNSARVEGSVTLIISETGTYLFAGQTAEHAAVGAGPLELREGRLIGETRQRVVTFTLYDRGGRPTIVVKSTNHETRARLYGEFTKTQ